MSETTAIEWCDSTFNPWIGCRAISPGCDNCYAEALAKRFGRDFHTPTRTGEANWKEPLRWNRKRFMACSKCGWRGECAAELIGCGACGSIDHLTDARRRVFCASMADVFDNQVPPEWREDLFELIRVTPHLDWLLLTKRPQNIAKMVRAQGAIAGNGTRYLPDNVRLGTTVEDQPRATLNLPPLLATRAELGARSLFISVEPMLGPLDLERPRPGPDLDQGHGAMICQPWLIQSGIDWVICGGESGPKARPMHPDWARSLRDQCAAAGVPFLFKQWGEWHPAHGDTSQDRLAVCKHGSAPFVVKAGEHARRFDLLDRCQMHRIGKKTAGRLLDGVQHDGFPKDPA